MIFLSEPYTFTSGEEAGEGPMVGKAWYGQRLKQRPRVFTIQRSGAGQNAWWQSIVCACWARLMIVCIVRGSRSPALTKELYVGTLIWSFGPASDLLSHKSGAHAFKKPLYSISYWLILYNGRKIKSIMSYAVEGNRTIWRRKLRCYWDIVWPGRVSIDDWANGIDKDNVVCSAVRKVPNTNKFQMQVAKAYWMQWWISRRLKLVWLSP